MENNRAEAKRSRILVMSDNKQINLSISPHLKTRRQVRKANASTYPCMKICLLLMKKSKIKYVLNIDSHHHQKNYQEILILPVSFVKKVSIGLINKEF